MSELKNTTNQSVDRAFKLIDILASTNYPMSLIEISRTLDITRSTAYSLVNSLINQHCIERNPVTKEYSIGYRFYEIGNQYRYHFPFLNTAEKHINLAYEHINRKINISVLKPDLMTIVILTKDSSLLPIMPHGVAMCAHAIAAGKVLLAFCMNSELERKIRDTELISYTKNTIVDSDRLMKELTETCIRGYAKDIEEISNNRANIGAPIWNFNGEIIAALSFSTTVQDMEENEASLIDAVMNLANNISMDLGYDSKRKQL